MPGLEPFLIGHRRTGVKAEGSRQAIVDEAHRGELKIAVQGVQRADRFEPERPRYDAVDRDLRQLERTAGRIGVCERAFDESPVGVRERPSSASLLDLRPRSAFEERPGGAREREAPLLPYLEPAASTARKRQPARGVTKRLHIQ